MESKNAQDNVSECIYLLKTKSNWKASYAQFDALPIKDALRDFFDGNTMEAHAYHVTRIAGYFESAAEAAIELSPSGKWAWLQIRGWQVIDYPTPKGYGALVAVYKPL